MHLDVHLRAVAGVVARVHGVAEDDGSHAAVVKGDGHALRFRSVLVAHAERDAVPLAQQTGGARADDGGGAHFLHLVCAHTQRVNAGTPALQRVRVRRATYKCRIRRRGWG